MDYNRERVIREHMEAKEFCKMAAAFSGRKVIQSSMADSPNAALPNVALIAENRISLDEIIKQGPNKVHAGKFFLGRSIAPCFKVNSVNLVVEDPKGDKAVPLVIYNYNPQPSATFSKTGYIPVGSVFALMSPWHKRSADGMNCLRCDNPKQFVLLDDEDPLVRKYPWLGSLPFPAEVAVSHDESDPGVAGSKYFKEGNYKKALRCYTKAIENNSSNAVMFANRAATYLALDKPSLALVDAETGLQLGASNVKLVFRKARALFLLKRYKECLEFLSSQSSHLNCQDVAMLMLKAALALEESAKGKYKLTQLYEEAAVYPLLDHAEFSRSDLFALKEPLPGFERGLLATRNIPAGTLLMASKAFVYLDPKKQLEIDVQIDSNDVTGTVDFNQSPLIALVNEKLLADPSLGKDFYKLWAGEKLRWIDETKYDPQNPIDIERIQEILRINSYCSTDGGKFEKFCALWLSPAYINHSCIDFNCVRQVIGDFMLIRTIKEVAEGEPLLMPYCRTSDFFEKRDQVLRRRSIICNCRLCMLESAETPEMRRKVANISDAFDEYLKSSSSNNSMKKLKNLLSKARVLRSESDNRSLNLLAFKIATSLGRLYLNEGQYDDTINLASEAEKAYEDLGLLDEALDACHGIRVAFSLSNRTTEAGEWEGRYNKIARLMLGDESLLPIYIRKRISPSAS